MLHPFHVFIVLLRGVCRDFDAVGANGNGDAPGIRGMRPGSGLFDAVNILKAAIARSVLGIRLLEQVEVGEVLESFVPVVLFFLRLALVSHHVLLREIFSCMHLHGELQNLVCVQYQSADGLAELLVLAQIANIRDDVSLRCPWLEERCICICFLPHHDLAPCCAEVSQNFFDGLCL